MRKILFFLLLFFCGLSVNAQKFFFESIEVNSYVYFDDIGYTKNNWKNQFQPLYHPLAQKFDSLNYYAPFREWLFLPVLNGGKGIQIRSVKTLPVFSFHSKSKLQWKTGLGFKTFRMSSEPFSFGEPPFDTTKIYFREGERFQLRQSFMDIYNSIIYKSYSKLPWCYGFIGFGGQTSFSISSKINDKYSSFQQKWNTVSRRWEEFNKISDTSLIPAKKAFIFAWTISFGLGFDLSKKISLEFPIEYFHARRSPVIITEKKYSEGAMLQLVIRYKL